MDLSQVGDVGEGLGVAEGNVDDAVVSQGGHGGEGSGLLTTAGSSSGDEETGLLAPVTAGGPDSTGHVPEGLYQNTLSVLFPSVHTLIRSCTTYLPLSGEVSISGGNAKQETVVLGEGLGILEDGDIAGLGRSVHLREDFLGQSLRELVDVDLGTSGLGTLLLGLGELPDVAVHGVLETCC